MLTKRIDMLKKYKSLLLECKRIQIINAINNEVEYKFPVIVRTSQKVLTRYKKRNLN